MYYLISQYTMIISKTLNQNNYRINTEGYTQLNLIKLKFLLTILTLVVLNNIV